MTNAARYRGAVPCNNYATFIAIGYEHTLCSLSGRPHTPQQRDNGIHPTIKEADLIKKKELLDPLEDDDDIEWKPNPFDVDHINEAGEMPEEIMYKITFEGSSQALALEFIDVLLPGRG